MEFEDFFSKLLEFYKVKKVTDLSSKLNISRSTVSGWKNRKAIAPILEYLFSNNIEALKYILYGQEKEINKDIIQINPSLMPLVKKECTKFGLDTTSYLEYLIIKDLKK